MSDLPKTQASASTITDANSALSEKVQTTWYASLQPDYTDKNEVLLLESGSEYFPELEQHIDAATDEIFFETYIFNCDDTGKKIAHALARAAQRGVSVHLVIDGFGTGVIKQELLQIFETGPIQLQIFRPEPKRFTLSRQRLRRLHRKLVMIDGTTAFVGGINVLDDLYDPNHGVLQHPRFDFALRIRGPLVPNVHLAMSRMWWQLAVTVKPFAQRARNTLLGKLSIDKDRLSLPDAVSSTATGVGNIRAKFVLRDNFRFRAAIEKSYLRAIDRAKTEIVVANAYFFPGYKFRTALIEAAKRGVRVRLLLQGKVEYKLQYYATQALYQELLSVGIEIVEYKKSFLHAKVAIADEWATVGSSNIDPFSLLLAREANVVVLDRAFAQDLKQKIEAAITDGGEPVLINNFEHRSVLTRIVHSVSYFMLRVAVAISGAAGRF